MNLFFNSKYTELGLAPHYTTYIVTDGRSMFLERLMKYAMKGKMATKMYYAAIDYHYFVNVAAAVVTERSSGIKWLSVTKMQLCCRVDRQEERTVYNTITTTRGAMKILHSKGCLWWWKARR
eukprot:GHVS01083091.1.p2 GENE.GHVS01083091.1~~GHVS01083091.1.p2  ORF type:complete len:122 (+),score=10.19 GHVS01083091.1:989-1354(+)